MASASPGPPKTNHCRYIRALTPAWESLRFNPAGTCSKHSNIFHLLKRKNSVYELVARIGAKHRRNQVAGFRDDLSLGHRVLGSAAHGVVFSLRCVPSNSVTSMTATRFGNKRSSSSAARRGAPWHVREVSTGFACVPYRAPRRRTPHFVHTPHVILLNGGRDGVTQAFHRHHIAAVLP
jgi:hypothetical protein